MHFFKPFILGITLLITLSACGVTNRSTEYTYRDPSATTVTTFVSNSKEFRDLNLIEKGVASWYGPKFHGRLTANGEVYDMDGLTAAHRTLAFGTVLLVENTDNGKTVKVRVNDRGPFAKDRIIDLSRKAAKTIDMMGPGTANVRLFLLKGDLENVQASNLKVANYTVQLGSFKTLEQAQTHSDKISGTRVEEIIFNGKKYFRVYFGTYQDNQKAVTQLKKLQKKGLTGFVKQLENTVYK